MILSALRASLRRWLGQQPTRYSPPRQEEGVNRRWLRGLLPATFLFIWAMMLAGGLRSSIIGFDARIYYRGAEAWLAGLDPWQASAVLDGKSFTYAGLPTTTIVLAPFTVLPEEVFVWLSVVLSLAGSVLIVRVLGLPPLWVAFPPLLYGALSANPNVIVVALLLSRNVGGGILASIVKVLAIPPLVGERRWTTLAGVAAAAGATMLFAPSLWGEFLRQVSSVSGAIHAESSGGMSAWGNWPLFVMTTIALGSLATIDLRAASWLAVPALFPTTQYHYGVFALAVDPFVAASMAIPIAGVPAIAATLYAGLRIGFAIRKGRATPGEAIQRAG